MNNFAFVLKSQFGVDSVEIIEIHGGLSAMNYKVVADDQIYFLKVYDKKKVQSSLWTENIDNYMPVLTWLNENTQLRGKIICPITTIRGDYRFDDDDYVFLLFEYIEGQTIGKTLTPAQLLEAAEIFACLHSTGGEVPVNMDRLKEDFSVPFCTALEHFILHDYAEAPADVKEILKPCLEQLLVRSNELRVLSEQVKQRSVALVLCHTDAHGYNLIQGKSLTLVDWEGIKQAPAEADLLMFTKKEYWDIFINRYIELRPDFKLDSDILQFYILRRKIEDIWAFIEGILHDDLTAEQRNRDLLFLTNCCHALDDLFFEL